MAILLTLNPYSYKGTDVKNVYSNLLGFYFVFSSLKYWCLLLKLVETFHAVLFVVFHVSVWFVNQVPTY